MYKNNVSFCMYLSVLNSAWNLILITLIAANKTESLRDCWGVE